MPYMVMNHEIDPKLVIHNQLGDISEIEIYNNQVLCAVYKRPKQMNSGLYLPEDHLRDDEHQSKVGLVIKKGPDAFIDENEKWFRGTSISIDDWVVFRPSDGWSITVHGVLCRILSDTNIKGRIQHPDQVW